MPGPKSSITQEQADRIIEALEAYSFLETAIAYAGVPKDTARDWIRAGRRDIARDVDSAQAQLVRRMDKVSADIKVKLTKGIAKAGFEDFIKAETDKGVSYERGDFRALTWIAEHRFKEFGLKKQIDEHLERCLDHFMDVAREVLDDVTYDRLCDALEAAEAARSSGEPSEGTSEEKPD